MKILITGANGMVARAAAEHCRRISDDVNALTREELDITMRQKVFEKLRDLRPDAVLNCAAYTNVDGAETDEEACYKVNAEGVENLAAASKAFGSRFVTISTDYVFDGKKQGFYTEDDAPKPQSVYARAKLDGEVRALNANHDSTVVRSCWIYGNRGKNFLSLIPQLLKKNEMIRAISDSYGTPTFAPDLAKRMRELVDLKASGIFHVTNSGPGTSYLGFAEKVCDIGGFDRSLIEPVSKDSLQRPAPRPVSSRLASVRIEKLGLAPLRDWETALAEFVSDKKSEVRSQEFGQILTSDF